MKVPHPLPAQKKFRDETLLDIKSTLHHYSCQAIVCVYMCVGGGGAIEKKIIVFELFFLLSDIPLPKEQRALLKWKMSTITPNVVKNCVARAGFTKCTSKSNWHHTQIHNNLTKSNRIYALLVIIVSITIGGSAWLGYWGRHMKASSFRNIKEHQKVSSPAFYVSLRLQ